MPDFLRFTALEYSTLTITSANSRFRDTLVVRTDSSQSWSHVRWAGTGTGFKLKAGEWIELKGEANMDRCVCNFEMSGKLAASGPVDSLIGFKPLYPGCYSEMFDNCTSLTDAPGLKLSDRCYDSMFENCTSLDI